MGPPFATRVLAPLVLVVALSVAGTAFAESAAERSTRSLNRGGDPTETAAEPMTSPYEPVRRSSALDSRFARQPARSDASLAVGLNVGTPGAGVALEARMGPLFVLRGGIETLGLDLDRAYDDVDYSGRFDFDTVSGFIDLHPLANAFFVSGGAYVGRRSIALEATPSAPVVIGGQTFTPAQVGTLSGRIKLENAAPFLGVGFDNTFTGTGRWGFRATAGVAWSPEPAVSLDSTGGTLSNDPNFRARLAQEEQSIQDDAKDYGLFPVLQAGLNYRF